MITIALFAHDSPLQKEWRGLLVEWGYRPWVMDVELSPVEQLLEKGTDLLLMEFLPGPESVTMLRSLKREAELKPVPVLAVVAEEHLRDLDFASGIEDFLVKEAPAAVLAARIRLALWRHSKVDHEETVKVSGLVMNLASYQVSSEGEPVDLTYKEYELLRFLMTRRGRVFTRDALLRHVWGDEYYGGTRTVDVHIRRLRAKLGPKAETLIETVRNVGYRFSADKTQRSG